MTKNEKENIKNVIASTRSDVVTYENVLTDRLAIMKSKIKLIEEGNRHLISDLPLLAQHIEEARVMLEVANINLKRMESLVE